MSLPFTMPDWVPWWVPIALLVPALLYALVFLFMPFSVLGVRGRLDSIEARLDEIQGEIRHLALRIPELSSRSHFDELYAAPPPDTLQTRTEPLPAARPPIPPQSRHFQDEPAPETFAPARRGFDSRAESGRRPVRPDRTEPRLNWPE